MTLTKLGKFLVSLVVAAAITAVGASLVVFGGAVIS